MEASQGPDYMANFSPGWNFSPTKGLITWRISARAEISAWLGGLKFCCEYIMNFSPGWNISFGAKYEIVCEKSPENQNGAENTNRENRRIASLVVWPFVGAQLLTFWDSNTLQWWWNWNETCLLARKTYLHIKKICPQACRVRGLPDSLVLFNLVSMFFYSIWALKLEGFSILSPLFHWDSFYFAAAAILFPAFQPGLKFRFDYMGFFQTF